MMLRPPTRTQFLSLCAEDRRGDELRAVVRFVMFAKSRGGSGRGSGRGDSAFVKVSGKLANFLGFKASSGRYIARGALTPVEDAFRLWKKAGNAIDDAFDAVTRAARDALRTQTVSNRQRAQASIRDRTGEVRTREKHAKHIKREIEAGRRGYSNDATAKAAEKNKSAAYARKLRRQIDAAANRRERIPEFAGPNAPKPLTKRVRKGRQTFTVHTGFVAKHRHSEYVLDLRERKLAGGELYQRLCWLTHRGIPESGRC